MAETELEKAEKRYAQAKARLQALRNREATKERKMDTRRKVILGGALLDLAARDSTATQMLDRLVRNLPRDHDRAAFNGWSPAPDGTGRDGKASDGKDRAAGDGQANAATGDPAPGAPPVIPGSGDRT